MRHPATVVAVGGVTTLVHADALHGLGVFLRVVLDGDERAHAANGRRAALVAGLEQQQGVGAHERHRHGDLRTVGQAEVVIHFELLDGAENVIPPARVQPGAVLAQLKQNLVHLERGEDGFHQHGGFDGALRQAQGVLRQHENLVPQPRFQMAFHLGQVKVGASAARDQLAGVVEKEQPEIEQAAAHPLAVHQQMFFVQMPAARANLQGGDGVAQRVSLAVLRQMDGAANGVEQIDLPFDLVGPVWRVGILEVGHIAVGARIEGVDDHLAIHRAGDLHAATLQRLGQRGDFPVALAHRPSLGEEIGFFTGVEAGSAGRTGRQQGLTTRLESAVQLGDEGQRVGSEDAVEARLQRGVQGDALRGGRGCHLAISVSLGEGLRLPRRNGLRSASAAAHLFGMLRVYAAPRHKSIRLAPNMR